MVVSFFFYHFVFNKVSHSFLLVSYHLTDQKVNWAFVWTYRTITCALDNSKQALNAIVDRKFRIDMVFYFYAFLLSLKIVQKVRNEDYLIFCDTNWNRWKQYIFLILNKKTKFYLFNYSILIYLRKISEFSYHPPVFLFFICLFLIQMDIQFSFNRIIHSSNSLDWEIELITITIHSFLR